MAKVSGVVCGVQVNDMIVMQSKFDGFDPHSCTKFKAGETIAYKNKAELMPEQAKAFFPSGKVFNLAVCWPLKSPGKKFETPSTPITLSIDNYVLPIPSILKKLRKS